MKRIALIVAGVLLVGCGSENKPAQPTSTTEATATTAKPDAPATAAPALPAAPAVPAVPAAPVAKAIPVYELTQDNKVYVFKSVDAMTEFQGGKPQPTQVEKPSFTPRGRTVVIEAADAAEAEQVMAGYVKLHPVTK